jgi:hypothetical protein
VEKKKEILENTNPMNKDSETNQESVSNKQKEIKKKKKFRRRRKFQSLFQSLGIKEEGFLDFHENDAKNKNPNEKIGSAQSTGSAFAKGKGAKASMITFAENIGPGHSQQSGSSTSTDEQSNVFGFSNVFFNPNRKQTQS